jgi:3D (Asp-Asp-Asp) domain-containing protein
LKRNGVVEVNGIILEAGVSVAAPYPPGTILDIEGIGQRVVHDKTATWIVERYDGRIVDIYFESHDEALRFGKHTRNVTIVSRGK